VTFIPYSDDEVAMQARYSQQHTYWLS